MFQLINWLVFRLRFFYYFPSRTLGLPVWAGYILAITVLILFFFALYDLFNYRNRGSLALLWLIVVLLVPLGSVLYLVFGSKQLRILAVPVLSPKPITGTVSTARPKVYAPYTETRNTTIVFGGIILISFLAIMLFFINAQGVATSTYADAAHYSTIAGYITWPLALIAGAWMAYIITHPRNPKPRSNILRIFLGVLGFFLGAVPGLILAIVITYPLSKHACQLSGSKYC